MGFSKKRGKAKSETSPGDGVTLGSLTHVGMKRTGNEDSFFAVTRPNAPTGIDMLVAVADGMGGHQAGEVASTMATQELLKRLSRGDGETATPSGGLDLDGRLTEAVREVNAQIRNAGAGPNTRGMGTTLTAAVLVGPTLFLAHVGDSRAYLLREGRLHQLTQDHSWVAEEVARGALTREEAERHPRRNVLTRALGLAPNVLVDGGRVDVQTGDSVLLCSDGLHSLVSDGELASVLTAQEPQEACRVLVDQANAMGGHDNITVVAARIDGIRNGTAPGGLQPELHQKTTMSLDAPPSGARKIARAVKLLSIPVWLPVWLLVKVLKLSLRKR